MVRKPCDKAGLSCSQSIHSRQRLGAGGMSGKLLSSQEAAGQLGISVASLYDWLARSDQGEFVLRGQLFTINYLQGGARGQGRIQIEEAEIERMKDAMRVRPQSRRKRRLPSRQQHYPGIMVELGLPDRSA